MPLFLVCLVRNQPGPNPAFRVPSDVLTDQNATVIPSARIACKLECIGLAVEVVAALSLDLVATNATRDRGVGHGCFQPLLGSAAAYKGVLRRGRFDPIVSAVGITTAVEICIARHARIYLRERKVFQALHLVRSFRPFPYEEIATALANVKIVTVLDRSESMGAHGPLFVEIRTALFDAPEKPMVYNRIYGLGGRELFMSDIHDIFEENKRYLETGKVEKITDYLKVRGG